MRPLALVLLSAVAAVAQITVKTSPEANLTLRHMVTGWTLSCKSDAAGVCILNPLSQGELRLAGTAEGLEGNLSLVYEGTAQEAKLVLLPALLRTSVTIISGSRQEELQEESANKVEAVTREQMLRTGYERVSDHLQEIPGVLVRRGSTSTVGGEQIQGIDSRQVLVLQDGLPVLGARGIKSGAVNLNRQSSDRLSRIEVAKGSSSATYGSDAIGGVINMITREPVQPVEAGFVLSGGTLGAFDGRGDIGGRLGKLSYFLNLGTNSLDSYVLVPNAVSSVGPEIRRQDGLFKTRYQFNSKFALGFTASAYRNREDGRSISETGPVNGLSKETNQSYAVVGDWVLDSKTTLQSRVYASSYDENNITTPLTGTAGPSPSNLNERLGRVDATLSRQLGNQHFLQGGAEWSQNLYRGVNRIAGDNVGQQVTTRDFWVQDKWTLNRRLTLTAGGRITQHSLFGGAAVPKAGLIYKVNNSWILRASFGMGFRAPDLGQLYYRFANPASFYQVIGNPTLQPEHSQSYQVGTVYRARQYRVGVTLFRNNIRDLIDSRLIGTPRTVAELNALLAPYNISPVFNPLVGRATYVYTNQSRIFTQGVELDGEYALSRQLRVAGSYTFLNAIDRISRLGLAQRHRHTGMTRVDYAIPKWGITANVRGTFYSHWLLNAATGTRGLPFQIWDTYVSKDLPRGAQLFAAVDNFANSRDGKLQLPVPTFDRPDYGRTVRVGLRYRFGAKE